MRGSWFAKKKATKKKPAQWLARHDTPRDRFEKEKEKKLKPNSVKSAVVDMRQNLRMEDYGDTAVWVFLRPEHPRAAMAQVGWEIRGQYAAPHKLQFW